MGTVGTPRDAHAKPPAAKAAKQPIGVGGFVGPQGPKVRAKVLKVLRDSGSYEVTDVEDVKPGSSTETYHQMAQGIQAEAIIVGSVSKSVNLTLSVYGANGARVDAIQIKGGTFPKLYKAVDNELEIAVADPLERAHPGTKAAAAPVAAAAAAPKPAKPADDSEDEEPEPKPKAAAKPKSDEEEELVDTDSKEEAAPSSDEGDSSAAEESPSEGGHGIRPIELMVGLRGYNRNFTYTGQTTPDLYPYSLAIAPTIWIAGRIYPLALSSDGALSNVGIMFRYEFGLATSTNYSQPQPGGAALVTTLKTHASEYQIGLRGRLPVGKHELGIFGVYGNHSFVLAGDEDPRKAPYALVPDVHYHYLRVGLDARFYISKLLVGVQVAPRFLTAMKELDKGGVWFPGATGSGLDFGALVGWQLLPWLTPTVGFDYVRYGFDFNNLPATPAPRVIAGGATDTFMSGWLGALFTFDLGGGAKDGSVSAEAKPAEPEEKNELDEEPEEKPKAAPKPKAAAKPKAKPAAEKHEAPPPPPPKPKAKAKASKGAPAEEEEEPEIE